MFYDLLLGRYSMKELSESDDIWTTIAPGQRGARAEIPDPRGRRQVTASNIITCREAYTALNGAVGGLIDEMTLVFGTPALSAPDRSARQGQAHGRPADCLPVSHRHLAQCERHFPPDADDQCHEPGHAFDGGASGTGSIDVYAQTRADIQTERTYGSIAHNAMKWVPILNVVLTVVFYALFPVLFPLFLMPRTGPIALRGYVTGFFYLAAWGPLFVILHMMLMFKGAGRCRRRWRQHGPQSRDLYRHERRQQRYRHAWQAILSPRSRSWPAAWRVVRWRFRARQRAISIRARTRPRKLARSEHRQRLARQLEHRQFDSVFPPVCAGQSCPQHRLWRGTDAWFQRQRHADDQLPRWRVRCCPEFKLSVHADTGAGLHGRLGTMASQSRTQSETYANLAQQSTSSALTRFSEIRNAYSQGQSSDTVSGVGTNDSIGTAFSEVDNASRTLQQQFGLSRRASDDITISWFLNGEAGAGAKAEGGVLNAQAGVRGGRNQSWTDSDIGIASEDRGRIMGTLRQLSDSRNWSNTREGFLRETSSSSVSQVSTSSSGLSRSLTEAESYTREARRAEEMASRLENQASWYEANSAAGTLNLSQAYREWGMAEIEANRDYYGPVRFDDIEFQMSARGQQLQSRFVESYADRLQDDIEADLSLPDFAPVSRPGIGSAGQVRARGAVGSAGGPSMPDAPDRSDITDEVERVRRQGRGRIGTVRTYLDRQTEGATGASEEVADDVKEWGNR